MRKRLSLFIALLLSLFSCESSSSVMEGNKSFLQADKQQEINSLNDHLRKYEEPSQFFFLSSVKASEIRGRKGTVISVNALDLETVSGSPIGEKIKVELKELTDQSGLLGSRAQTVSDNLLLVSGGAYYIAMSSNGEELKLKQGRKLKVVFPKYAKEEMTLFYGQRDSLGLMNWQKAEGALLPAANDSDPAGIKGFVPSSDIDTAKGYGEFYKAIDLGTLGWVNCDRFLEVEEKAGLWVSNNSSDSASIAKVFLVFRKINSVMEGHHDRNAKGDSILIFDGLPVGYNARLIAIMKRGNKFYAHASDVTVGQGKAVGLQYKPVTAQDLKLLISK